MVAKRANWNELYDPQERAIARLAGIARNDCWQGGCSAMMLSDKAQALDLPFSGEASNAVSQAYSSGTGTASDYLAYECPECGSVVLGEDNAYAHCVTDDYEETL